MLRRYISFLCELHRAFLLISELQEDLPQIFATKTYKSYTDNTKITGKNTKRFLHNVVFVSHVWLVTNTTKRHRHDIRLVGIGGDLLRDVHTLPRRCAKAANGFVSKVSCWYHVDIMLISWSVSTSFKMFHVSKCFETSWVVQKMPKKCQEHTLPDPACISASSPCSSHLTELGSPEPALRPELDAKYMEIPSPQSINKLWWASDELTVSYSVLSLSQERSRSTEFTKRHAQVHPSYLLVFDSSC